MEKNRTLQDIFQSMEALAAAREQTQPTQKEGPCLCGQKQSGENVNQDDYPAIYIKTTELGSRFAICPVCDPALTCYYCNALVGYQGHKIISNGEADFLELHSCSCQRTKKIVEKLNNAQIPEKYINAEFNQFKCDHLTDTQKDRLLKNQDEFLNFINQILPSMKKTSIKNKKKYFVTLFGAVGTGKTLMAAAGLKYIIKNFDIASRFIDFQYLLGLLKSQFDEKRSGEDLLKEIKTTGVLIIDEFGKGRNDKEWNLEKLDDIINYRYNEKKLTILTTNYAPAAPRKAHSTDPFEDLYSSPRREAVNDSFWHQSLSERIGERMYERLLEVSIFLDFTKLPSYRKNMAKNFLALYQENNG